MAIDPYAACPGGTGKKVKFCCDDLTGDLEQIDRLIEGDQISAALEQVERLAAKTPGQRIPGGWRRNALRHSYISYRVAKTGDVPRTALEAGNSPEMIFRHYREIVDEQSAEAWFAITPPDGWQPGGLSWNIRERLRKLAGCQDEQGVDTAHVT